MYLMRFKDKQDSIILINSEEEFEKRYERLYGLPSSGMPVIEWLKSIEVFEIDWNATKGEIEFGERKANANGFYVIRWREAVDVFICSVNVQWSLEKK